MKFQTRSNWARRDPLSFSHKGRRKKGRPRSYEGKASHQGQGSNGAQFADGDSVALIRDLKLKGSSTVLKRGTVIKNINLTDDPTKSKAAPARSRAWCSARRF
jgi:uncharacterized Zn ribbon protein